MVEKLWPGETFVILASGPSLTSEDVAFVRGKARVIAVNTSHRLAPWGDALWATDGKWWQWEKGAKGFKGRKYSLDASAAKWGVTVVQNTGANGLELSPTGVRHGRNGGYAAINLAVHLGAARVLLLGYDMQRGPKKQEHWHPDHPTSLRSPYPLFVKTFASIVTPLEALKIQVVNCSRVSALPYFPRLPLSEALATPMEMAS